MAGIWGRFQTLKMPMNLKKRVKFTVMAGLSLQRLDVLG